MKIGKISRGILMVIVAMLVLSLCACFRGFHKHELETILAVPATCAKAGQTEGAQCTICGKIVQQPQTLNMLPHTEETVPARAATCKQTGLSEGKRCSVCKTVLQEQTVLEKGTHEYEEKIATAASCTDMGTMKFTCKHCGDSYTESYEQKPIEASDLFERVEPSVAEITAYAADGNSYSIGSGFVYSADGKIVTNYHVIEGTTSATVKIDGKSYKAEKVLAYDKDKDIAILKIDASNLSLLPICTKTHKTGATVYAFGSSKGLSATFSNGIITHAERNVEGVMHIQHNADISGGNSGGPLINEYGEIIGINTFTLKDSQNLNFAIHASEIKSLKNNTAMTLQQVCEKENDVFTKLKTLATTKGTYRSSDKEYALPLNQSTTANGINVYLYYETDINHLVLCIFYTDESGWEVQVSFVIDQVDGSYRWYYFDDYDNYMTGMLYAATYDESTLLGVSDYELENSLDSVRELASLLMNRLCGALNTGLKDAGVTAKDLGFQNY